MTRVLIPRSDNRNAKKIETSDFEKFFDDILDDYIKCGMCMTTQCPNVLAVDVAAGKMRLGGIYLENTTPDVVTCLLPCDTNYVYASLCRDPNCEPQGWLFQSNITGCTPVDSMIIGTVTTDCSGVIACGINQIASTCLTNGVSGLNRTSGLGKSTAMFGNGVDGCVTICTCTTLNETKYYNNLTVNAGVVLDICSSPQIIFVKDTLTVNGTISATGKGAAGGAGGSGGVSPGGAGSAGCAGSAATNLAAPGGAGGASGSCGAAGTGGTGGDANGSPNPAEATAGTNGTASGGSGGGGGGGGTNGVPGPPGTCGSPGGVAGRCGGAGGATATSDRTINHLTCYLSTKNNLLGAGGGGGGGTSAGGKGGDGGGPSTPPGNGGAGGVGGTGGPGGAGGGTLIIAAQNIIVGVCGIIEARGQNGSCGGDGGNGANGSNATGPLIPCRGGGGGGGGGAGGSGTGGGGGGGVVALYFYEASIDGLVTADAGAGGTNPGNGGTGGAGVTPAAKTWTFGAPGGNGGDGGGGIGSSGTNGILLQVLMR